MLIVNVFEHVGLHEFPPLRDIEELEGNPETENVSDWVVPEIKFAVIVFEPELP